MTHRCLFCNQSAEPVHVHGHYQCPVCNTNILPCCDCDNADTNFLFNQNEEVSGVIHPDKLALHLQFARLKKPQ